MADLSGHLFFFAIEVILDLILGPIISYLEWFKKKLFFVKIPVAVPGVVPANIDLFLGLSYHLALRDYI